MFKVVKSVNFNNKALTFFNFQKILLSHSATNIDLSKEIINIKKQNTQLVKQIEKKVIYPLKHEDFFQVNELVNLETLFKF